MVVLFFDPVGQELRRHRPYLTARGYLIHAHTEPLVAIDAAASDLPDVVIAIQQEPGAPKDPALAVCRALVENPQTRDIPLVLMATELRRPMHDQPIAATCLTLPCAPEQLYARINLLRADARRRSDRSAALRAAADRYRSRRR